MLGKAPDAAAFLARGADQRIHVAHVAGQIAMEHALAQPVGGDDQALRAEFARDEESEGTSFSRALSRCASTRTTRSGVSGDIA